ncbi:hypothetical protein [Schlesneria paludicola]|uniref:hypothetical protein n=1 Tax=Schlesneria paludicola TaxID=360056 RepID=UPI00029A9B6B|nr:hypothetical protein [Schlesneria paludicola]
MSVWNQLYQYQRAMSVWQWAFALTVIGLAIWLIIWLRTFFREDADDADDALEMLTQFRDLHQEGGLSDDEFRLIRSRLTHIAQEANLAGRTETKERSADAASAVLADQRNKASVQSPAQHAIAERNGESVRITDEETEST